MNICKRKLEGEKNPYKNLPKMVLMTYQMPESFFKYYIMMEYLFNLTLMNILKQRG